MLKQPKYNFKTDRKEEFFARCSMKEIAERMEMTNVYLSYLVNNKYPFNEFTAKTLMDIVGFSKTEIKEKFNDFFVKI